jgi:hypothetical protein
MIWQEVTQQEQEQQEQEPQQEPQQQPQQRQAGGARPQRQPRHAQQATHQQASARPQQEQEQQQALAAQQGQGALAQPQHQQHQQHKQHKPHKPQPAACKEAGPAGRCSNCTHTADSAASAPASAGGGTQIPVEGSRRCGTCRGRQCKWSAGHDASRNAGSRSVQPAAPGRGCATQCRPFRVVARSDSSHDRSRRPAAAPRAGPAGGSTPAPACTGAHVFSSFGSSSRCKQGGCA